MESGDTCKTMHGVGRSRNRRRSIIRSGTPPESQWFGHHREDNGKRRYSEKMRRAGSDPTFPDWRPLMQSSYLFPSRYALSLHWEIDRLFYGKSCPWQLIYSLSQSLLATWHLVIDYLTDPPGFFPRPKLSGSDSRPE